MPQLSELKVGDRVTFFAAQFFRSPRSNVLHQKVTLVLVLICLIPDLVFNVVLQATMSCTLNQLQMNMFTCCVKPN